MKVVNFPTKDHRRSIDQLNVPLTTGVDVSLVTLVFRFMAKRALPSAATYSPLPLASICVADEESIIGPTYFKHDGRVIEVPVKETLP